MKTLSGHLLVASTELPDPNFAQTVVLVVEHDENGALGVVLNRPSNYTLKEIWEQVTDQACDSEQPLNLGGPLVGPLMAVHTVDFIADKGILPGVYFSTDKDSLLKLVGQNHQPYRIFTGYSGWGKGQLDGEVANGDWLVTPATVESIFAGGDDPWEVAVRDIKDQELIRALRIRHVPVDPSAN